VKTYAECWAEVAAALFSQALAGEPELSESLPKPLGAGSFGFAAMLAGDVVGRFSVVLDGGVLETPLLGEGVDQKTAWKELLNEAAGAAAGDLLAATGKKCHVASFEETAPEAKITQAFQLRAGERVWTVLVRDEVHDPVRAEVRDEVQTDKVQGDEVQVSKVQPAASSSRVPSDDLRSQAASNFPAPSAGPTLSPGLELLLDVELEASLRFGSREMPLGEILDLGPGDVVELDRHVADPVDLIVGDKIVARGEVVLVNGNFGLRVTEVAAPRKRLERIRCLF
jgi:flagellar motor switch protein FliN